MKDITYYYHMAKILETVDKLEADGYIVQTDYRVDDLEFDIYATKNNQKDLYIEVKSAKYSERAQKRITKMLEYVKSLENAKFELLVATPPLKKEIEIEDINNILAYYLSENLPESLRSLSYKTVIDYVNDIELNSILITSNEIEVLGTGSIEIIMYADSEDEDGFNDVFPCEFHLFLDMEFNIHEQPTIRLTSWREMRIWVPSGWVIASGSWHRSSSVLEMRLVTSMKAMRLTWREVRSRRWVS